MKAYISYFIAFHFSLYSVATAITDQPRIVAEKIYASGVAKTDVCHNNPLYTYNFEREKTCSWIRLEEKRRNIYCLEKEVHFYCPQTCGDCCQDDTLYVFQTPFVDDANCEWLSKRVVRQDEWCDKFMNNRMVYDACPVTCDYCQELIDYKTSAPTVSTQPTSIPTSTPSFQPSNIPSTKPSVTPTSKPTQQLSSIPTSAPTLQPSNTPSTKPSVSPTMVPSIRPSKSPTINPSDIPSIIPTSYPTTTPSMFPSKIPTGKPSTLPTTKPSLLPSVDPSMTPSKIPSYYPTGMPSVTPTTSPTSQPSAMPSSEPSSIPSIDPTKTPSRTPTDIPSTTPSRIPSLSPSKEPSLSPTILPSILPSAMPTSMPSLSPTITCLNDDEFRMDNEPLKTCKWIRNKIFRRGPFCKREDVHIACPVTCGVCCRDNTWYTFETENVGIKDCAWISEKPVERAPKYCDEYKNGQMVRNACPLTCNMCQGYISLYPSTSPTAIPSPAPSMVPSDIPSMLPTLLPSTSPSTNPSTLPSVTPSAIPSLTPSTTPSMSPSLRPSSSPSVQPSGVPSVLPSHLPSVSPTAQPSVSGMPSDLPSLLPSALPSMQPSNSPTLSRMPSMQPSDFPTLSMMPSMQPSDSPTFCKWTQMGGIIEGDFKGDKLGPVSLSSDGLVVAVGAYKSDDAGIKAGYTRVFEYTTSWNQRGETILGPSEKDQFGRSVSLSDDGNSVAIGSPKNDDGADRGGKVTVWVWDGSSTWVQRGSDILGMNNNGLLGTSVSITPNGLVVIAGAPGKRAEGRKGTVQVWTFVFGIDSNGYWEQRHNTIIGDNDDEYFGTSVAITFDASTIAVGAPETANGSVFVYVDDGSDWVLTRNEIYGESVGDRFGQSLALIFNGGSYILAVGAPDFASGNGRVYVYTSSNDGWDQIGSFDGDNNGDAAGTAVDLSANGSVLAIGYPGNDRGLAENASGYTRVFQYDASKTTWIQVHDDILGTSRGEKYGEYVALSSNGKAVGIGSELAGKKVGKVGVFQDECI